MFYDACAMAAKNTVFMISALSDELRLKFFEILADSDRSDSKLAEMTNTDVDDVREQMQIICDSGLAIAMENGDSFDYSLDPQQVAVVTGFFDLMLNKCSPPKCC